MRIGILHCVIDPALSHVCDELEGLQAEGCLIYQGTGKRDISSGHLHRQSFVEIV